MFGLMVTVHACTLIRLYYSCYIVVENYTISKVFEQKFNVKKGDRVSVVDDTLYIQVRY